MPLFEGDGQSQSQGQVDQQGVEGIGQRACGFAGLSDDGEQAGGAFVQGEHGLAVDGEQHQIGFPMSAVCGDRRRPGRALLDGDALWDGLGGGAAFASAPAAFALAARQVEAPAVILGAGDLCGDEAIDRLMMITGRP